MTDNTSTQIHPKYLCANYFTKCATNSFRNLKAIKISDDRFTVTSETMTWNI